MTVRPFVPAFDALWQGSKVDLHGATRSIFLQLCIAARNAGKDGVLMLPRADGDAASIKRIVLEPIDEVETALVEMTDPDDPMVEIRTIGQRRVLTILSWGEWVISDAQQEECADANLVYACLPCNLKKGPRTPEQAGMPLLPIPEKAAS